MCGIVGYTGNNDTLNVLLNGLKRLEYRGYDSAGVAVLGPDSNVVLRKKSGKLKELVSLIGQDALPKSNTGIGHTRWATHGGPTDTNAHPHLADNGRLALIHNGIIENFAELKEELLDSGCVFESETDTEVVAAKLAEAYSITNNLELAFRQVVPLLRGTFTLLAVHANEPGVIVSARHNSPLVIGLGEGENFLASDVAAFVQYTQRAVSVDDNSIAVISDSGVRVTDFFGAAKDLVEFVVDWDASSADKGGWSSFMLKEVFEQPTAVANSLAGRVKNGRVLLDNLTSLDDSFLRGIERIVIVACGTAYYSASVAKYAFEAWARVPVSLELSHEFRYMNPVLNSRTLLISVSQSGETMDTLMAVKYAKKLGVSTLAICNTQSASIPRESDAVIYTHAGPEVAVASTKAFVAQIIAMYLFALHLAEVKDSISGNLVDIYDDLLALPDKLTEVLDSRDSIKELAHWMADTRSVLFLGRHLGFPIALEGALKLKEISYIHAEGFAAGELKHGPIALIEPGQPVFVVVPSPRNSALMHSKVVSNIQEIRARGARVIAIAEKGDTAVLPYADVVIALPLAHEFLSPILAVVPLQIFALELATAKGLDVDQPRNLAKSVTVE